MPPVPHAGMAAQPHLHRPRMSWCPSFRGPLSLRVLQQLALVKAGLYGQYGITVVRLIMEIALCSSQAGRQHALVTLSITDGICACVSGTMLLSELGVLGIGCAGRSGARSAVFSRVATPTTEVKLLWLHVFLFFSGVGGLVKGAFALVRWADLGGNMVTLCAAEADCRCSLLDNIWFEGFTAVLQLGTVVLCCKALMLINEDPLMHADDSALLAVLRGAIISESPKNADGDAAAGAAPSIQVPSTPRSLQAGTISICTPQHSENEGSGDEGAGEDALCGIRTGRSIFRINVPDGWPGVQYRRTRHLDDRYPRYAVNGTIIRGRLMEDDEWLCIGSNVFLPVRIGTIRLIEPVDDEP
mmetsp:Transcript_120957/g.240958  ORF Transcript_120957/g.240958 Transcript_120957/m.240958 type:complete len:357 (+) Transcript_120957:15-1085(+)